MHDESAFVDSKHRSLNSEHLEWTLRKLSYVRRGGRESTFTHRYASLVETFHSHSS